MNFRIFLTFLLWCVAVCPYDGGASGGITPEQIYQETVEWKAVVGTWEVLPEDNPLAENGKTESKASNRTLMTLRKDGTCRIFNKEHPTGSDGMWYYDKHEMFITLPNGTRVGFFVYGVKGDFMVTRSLVTGGKDQLWSRVK
ncbi:MAG: hypothetical protein RDU20_04660 [Desulfomonilaceae bacterium]|nr:hypothetical protein [Desulfomonilaceae bacterium]